MKLTSRWPKPLSSLVLTFGIIALCEFFFMLDVIADYFYLDIDTTWINHMTLEFIVTVALAVALISIGVQIIKLYKQHQQAQKSVQVARGDIMVALDHQFMVWQLTSSEQEVAMLLIKGFSLQEIADLRNTQPGTVKSQASAVYKKSDVKNRYELISYFIEDLLAKT